MPAHVSPRSARFSRFARGLFAGLAGVAVAASAHAQAEADHPMTLGSGLRISGFGSVGVSHVDAPAGWGFRREVTQPGSDSAWREDIDTRVGVQLNYSLSNQVELVAQAIAKRRARYANDLDALEWAYVAYRPTPDWTVRAGRVNLDAFLMADYRNVGYGFMAARPPVELYALLPTTLDGADVARSWIVGDAQWRAKLMVGSAPIGDIESAKPGRIHRVMGAMVSREESGLLLRASVARTRINMDLSDYQPALDALAQLGQFPIPSVAQQATVLRGRLGASGVWATFSELGVRHELAEWQWSAELVHISADPLIKQTSFYANAGRRIGDWTPYVGYSRTRDAMPVLDVPAWQALLSPIIGPAAAAQAQALGSLATGAVNGSRLVQSSWSVGARWDFHPQAALKLQWERLHMSAGGTGLWRGADGSQANANVATAVVDFIF